VSVFTLKCVCVYECVCVCVCVHVKRMRHCACLCSLSNVCHSLFVSRTIGGKRDSKRGENARENRIQPVSFTSGFVFTPLRDFCEIVVFPFFLFNTTLSLQRLAILFGVTLLASHFRGLHLCCLLQQLPFDLCAHVRNIVSVRSLSSSGFSTALGRREETLSMCSSVLTISA